MTGWFWKNLTDSPVHAVTNSYAVIFLWKRKENL